MALQGTPWATQARNRRAQRSSKSSSSGWCWLLLLAQWAAVSWCYAASTTREFNIPAGPFSETSYIFTIQAGVGSWGDTGLENTRTQALVGRMTLREALDRFVDGTDITYSIEKRDSVNFHRARGDMRWFDIPQGDARVSLQRFADSTDLELALARPGVLAETRTAAVKGCLSTEAAAQALLEGTGLKYEWLRSESGQLAVLRVNETLPPGNRHEQLVQMRRVDEWVLPTREEDYCRRLCHDGQIEGDTRPVWHCVSYSPLAR
jgi:hypothetical protein